jgi:Ca2+-binding RTX toxin-like protein
VAGTGIGPAGGARAYIGEGGWVRYTAGTGEANEVTITNGANATVIVVDDVVPIEAGEGCTHPDEADPTRVTCAHSGSGSGQLIAELGDMNDAIDVRTESYSFVLAGPGDDVLTGTDGSFRGEEGNDTLSGSTYQWGGDGHDTLTGTEGDDTLYGDWGRDTIRGHGGDDLVYGHGSDDEIRAGAGNDSVYGGNGADTIYGGSGDDTLDGGRLTDTIVGGPGNDEIHQD